MKSLTPHVRTRKELETIVKNGWEKASEVYAAAKEIHERKLYLETHTHWATYLKETFGVSKSDFYRKFPGPKPKESQAGTRKKRDSNDKPKDLTIEAESVVTKEAPAKPPLDTIVLMYDRSEIDRFVQQQIALAPELAVPLDQNGDPNWTAPLPQPAPEHPTLAALKASGHIRPASQMLQPLPIKQPLQEDEDYVPEPGYEPCGCQERLLEGLKQWQKQLDPNEPLTFDDLMEQIRCLTKQHTL